MNDVFNTKFGGVRVNVLSLIQVCCYLRSLFGTLQIKQIGWFWVTGYHGTWVKFSESGVENHQLTYDIE